MISSIEAYRYLRATMTECSQKAGWRSLLLRAYDDPPVVEPFTTPPTQDHLIVLVTKGTSNIEGLYRGKWQKANYGPGSLGMTAPGEEVTLRWRGDTSHSTLQLHLPAESILRCNEDVVGHNIRKARTRDAARMQRVCDYMHAHLAEEVSLQDLAKVAYVSRFHLIRMFKQTYGETPYQRLARLRIERAQRLLATSDTPITAGPGADTA